MSNQEKKDHDKEEVKKLFDDYCEKLNIKKAFVLMQIVEDREEFCFCFPRNMNDEEILALITVFLKSAISSISHDSPLEKKLKTFVGMIVHAIDRQTSINESVRRVLKNIEQEKEEEEKQEEEKQHKG